MEVFDQLDLSDQILNLPHQKIRNLSIGGVPLMSLKRLKTKFPFITMIAQSILLDFLAKETAKYPAFTLKLDANARDLVRDQKSGNVVGVRARINGEEEIIRAKVVVGCDGRSSKMRRKAGLEIVPATDPIDVLWFRLNKEETDPPGGAFRISHWWTNAVRCFGKTGYVSNSSDNRPPEFQKNPRPGLACFS